MIVHLCMLLFRLDDCGTLTIFQPSGVQYSGSYTCIVSDSKSSISSTYLVSVQGMKLFFIFLLVSY